jgi:hypothetical protein
MVIIILINVVCYTHILTKFKHTCPNVSKLQSQYINMHYNQTEYFTTFTTVSYRNAIDRSLRFRVSKYIEIIRIEISVGRENTCAVFRGTCQEVYFTGQ